MEHKISVVEEKKAKTKSGGLYLLLDLLGWAVDIAAFVFGIIFMVESVDNGTMPLGVGITLLVVSILGLIGMIIFTCGFHIIQPNQAMVFTLFGKYYGTVKEPGFYYVNPFCSAVAPQKVDAGASLNVANGTGTTNVAVLSMNGVAVSSSLKIAGNYFDEMIARYVRRQHGVVIGQVTAEQIKIQIGEVFPRDEERSMNVKGRDFKTGMPKMVTLTSKEIYEVLRRPARQIADEVLAVLEETSPELVSDISENGITLTGGCSQIWGMDLLLMERTGIACILADDPDSCTAYGAGKSLAWINNMQEGPINIARKRAMKSGL